jgi:hypothetical protein
MKNTKKKNPALVSYIAVAAGLALTGAVGCKSDKNVPVVETSAPATGPSVPTSPPSAPVAAAAVPAAVPTATVPVAPLPEAPVAAAPVPAPVHSEVLTDSQMERTTAVQSALAEVDPAPLEEWIEDVTRFHNPERELKMYEGMAKAYRAYCKGKTLSHEAKMEVYQVVLLRSGAKDSVVLPQLNLKELSLADAKGILRHYPLPPSSPTESRPKK